jgi:hypothetical protein
MCLYQVRLPVAQPPAEAGLEASPEIQQPQGAERPCYEAVNSACRGEWRRGTGSQMAPNAGAGKESVVEYCFEPRGNAETAGMRILGTTADRPIYVKDWLKRK